VNVGKKKKRNKRLPAAPATEPGGGLGGLAAALSAKGFAASPDAGEGDGPRPAAASSGAATGLKGKVVVRQERKGRGGKTVTVIDGAAIRRIDDLEAFAKKMRKALGAGSRVEGGKVIVQGDQRESAARWLSKQGATVVIGN